MCAMKTILVVDDEKGIRDSLKMVLEYESYEVIFADNGQEALRQLTTASSRPDLARRENGWNGWAGSSSARA